MSRKVKRRRRKVLRKSGSLFEAAVDAFRSGDIARAEEGLRLFLENDPEHADANHLLGLCAYQGGRHEAALEAIGRAVALDDANPFFHSNHGVVLNLLGRAGEGESACRRAIELRPAHAEAHNNLAVALKLQGRLLEAEGACRQAISLIDDYAEAHVNLGNILRQQGRSPEAVEAYRRAVDLAPDNALAHSNLGAALRETGELRAAVEHCRRAVELKPGSAEAHNNMGNALWAEGNAGGAEAAFRQAVFLRPGYGEALVNLGALLYSLERLEEAEAAYRQAVAASGEDVAAQCGLGVVLLAVSRLDEALDCFRAALDHDPTHAGALYNLASSRAADLSDAETRAIEQRLEGGELSVDKRIAVHFSLGEIYDAKGDFKAAFTHFKAGNNLRSREMAQQGRSFDVKAHERQARKIAKAFTPALFAEMEGCGEESPLPVFIVGMPRSGTTLAEQIAASHGEAHGAGELNEIVSLCGAPSDVPSRRESQAAAHTHLRRLAGRSPGAARVVDKTPFNYLHLGQIALLFPAARIIHCVRDERDLRLSCYFQNFVQDYPWSTSLEGLDRYMGVYRGLMEHWQECLPLPMLELSYEELVADLEGQSRRIIDFLGLPWDAACLGFHENRRTVRTASSWQVRRPIYATSVGRWKNYENITLLSKIAFS